MDHQPLVVSNLSFQYRTAAAPAISAIDFALARGELLLVAGSSGCGKSTLLRCINGLIPRSYKGQLHGQVLLGGEATTVLSLARIAQLVGTVLQDPEKQIIASYVAEDVAFGPENLGWSRSEIHRAVDAALDELGILHLKERETFRLSGGEKQKVALAGLLAMQPQLLLLDEPLASLDPHAAHEALALIRRQTAADRSVLLVEHRVEDVLSIQPERALLMQAGQQRYLGDTTGLLRVADPREVKLPPQAAIERLRVGATTNGAHRSARRSATGGEPLVRLEDVVFWYGDNGPPVLKGISLDVRKGDVIALLGPNGTGKSTLVKHMIGLLKPREGRVLVEGQDTRSVTTAQIARTLGYVFQSPTHMLFAPTVREELAFGPRNMGVAEHELADRIEHALAVAGLQGSEARAPLSMSFGQQKRVGIAAVLAMGSRILLMDEPTAGQDYQSYTRFMDEVTAMGTFDAVLFITHDLDLALTYANRVLLMADGQLAADGPPEQALRDDAVLRRSNVLPTPLLEINRGLLEQTERFMGLRELAASGVDIASATQVVDKINKVL